MIRGFAEKSQDTWEVQMPMIRQEERKIGYAEGKDKGKIEGKNMR